MGTNIRQDIKQALIYIDDNRINFYPFSLNQSLALIPLINVPFIDYTIDILVASGIEEIFFVASKYHENLKLYIEANKWQTRLRKVNLTLYTSESCSTIGDALREIYNKGAIKSDFILINGLIVTTLDFKPLLDLHKKRCYKDKINSLMTLIFCKTSYKIPLHMNHRYLIMYNTLTDQLLFFQSGENLQRKLLKIQFPMEIIEKCKNTKVLYNLLNTHIYICSPQVPQFFADNFDYQNITHFISDILINEEILGSLIHIHIDNKAYIMPVTDLSMYYKAGLDILNHWTYPIIPEKWRHSIGNSACDARIYKCISNHKIYFPYDDSHCKMANDCKLVSNVVISSNCQLNSGSTLQKSIIGSNCTIGDKSIISQSILWDNVTVGSNCLIDTSILASHTVMGDGVKLSPHCLIAENVILPPNIILPTFTVCVSHKDSVTHFLSSFRSKRVKFSPTNTNSDEKRPSLAGHIGPKYRLIDKSLRIENIIPQNLINAKNVNTSRSEAFYLFRAIPAQLLRSEDTGLPLPYNLITGDSLVILAPSPNNPNQKLGENGERRFINIPTYILKKSTYQAYGPTPTFVNVDAFNKHSDISAATRHGHANKSQTLGGSRSRFKSTSKISLYSDHKHPPKVSAATTKDSLDVPDDYDQGMEQSDTTFSESNSEESSKSFTSEDDQTSSATVSSIESDHELQGTPRITLDNIPSTTSSMTSSKLKIKAQHDGTSGEKEHGKFVNKMQGDSIDGHKGYAYGMGKEKESTSSSRNRTISNDEHYIMSQEDTRGCYFELQESFQRCQEEKFPIKNLILEINASKHAYNITLQDLWYCMAKITFDVLPGAAQLSPSAKSKGPEETFIRYKNIASTYKELLGNYFKTVESQSVILDRILAASATQSLPELYLVKYLHYLYEIDIVSEEAIVQWFEIKKDAITLLSSKVFGQMETFVKWLKEAEEEEEDDNDLEEN